MKHLNKILALIILLLIVVIVLQIAMLGRIERLEEISDGLGNMFMKRHDVLTERIWEIIDMLK